LDKAKRPLREQRWRHVVEQRLLKPRADRPPELIEKFDDSPVLVVAPHFDDETIGCGGTILRHRAAGAKVAVLYLTDGTFGNRELKHDPSLTAIRKGEARRAAELLGGLELRFLDLPDRGLKPDGAMVDAVAGHVREIKPAVVYLPSIFDTHPDHVAACHATSAAAARVAPHAVLREYEVWAPLVPNRLADVSDVLETKLAALRCFASQLDDLDYVAVARGLAMYRSLYHLHGRGAAEAFCEFSPATHQAILRGVDAVDAENRAGEATS
jgi:LmbE family N-acetylglucosaminyl deacetylase